METSNGWKIPILITKQYLVIKLLANKNKRGCKWVYKISLIQVIKLIDLNQDLHKGVFSNRGIDYMDTFLKIEMIICIRTLLLAWVVVKD